MANNVLNTIFEFSKIIFFFFSASAARLENRFSLKIEINSGMLIKSYYKDSVRRFTQESPLFERIQDTIKEIYKLPRGEVMHLFYKDDEGDWICLSNDTDVSHALRISDREMIYIKVCTTESEEGE